MSWFFSRALVAAYSEENSLDGAAFVLSKLIAPPLECSSPAKTMGALLRSQYGTTSEPSTADLGADLLMWFRRGFRARTCPVSTPMGPDLPVNALDCGPRQEGSFARWDRRESCWKTAQCSLFGGLSEFSEIWPKWGMMRDGECLALAMPADLSAANASGLLPAPLADDWKGGTVAPHSKTGKSRDDQLRHWCKIHHGLTYPIPEHSEALMGWPIGWSDWRQSATDKFRQWCDSHGVSCTISTETENKS